MRHDDNGCGDRNRDNDINNGYGMVAMKVLMILTMVSGDEDNNDDENGGSCDNGDRSNYYDSDDN